MTTIRSGLCSWETSNLPKISMVDVIMTTRYLTNQTYHKVKSHIKRELCNSSSPLQKNGEWKFEKYEFFDDKNVWFGWRKFVRRWTSIQLRRSIKYPDCWSFLKYFQCWSRTSDWHDIWWFDYQVCSQLISRTCTTQRHVTMCMNGEDNLFWAFFILYMFKMEWINPMC